MQDHSDKAAPELFRWDDVRVFLQLAREGSLTRGAQVLGVNPSTASRRLAALEAALGVKLFERTPEGLVETGAAEQLLAAAEGLERSVLELQAALDGLERVPEGRVRITAPPGLADVVLAPALPRLLARFPRLRFDIDARTDYVDLGRREADIALRAVRPTTGDLVSRRLVLAADRVFASPGYARELGRVKDWREVRWITWDKLAHIPMARWVQAHAPGVEPILKTDQMASQLAAARAGLGAILLSEPFAELATGLVRVEPSRALAKKTRYGESELWMVTSAAARRVPRIAAVWDFILSELNR